MNIVKRKLIGVLSKLLRGQKGFSILAVIFVMLVLSAIGYSLAKTMATKQKTVPVTAQSNRAFSVADGCTNWAGKYLSELEDWTSTVDRTGANAITLGGGKFEVTFSNYDDTSDPPNESIEAQCTGYYENGKRVISMEFKREISTGCWS